MNKIYKLLCIAIIFAACSHSENKPAKTSINFKVDSVFALMTVKEKLGQLHQAAVYVVDSTAISKIKSGEVGSVLNSRINFYSVEDRNRMQKAAIEGSRLKIPLLFAHDVVHGYETTFPINLAQACSWDSELVKKAAEIAAIEASNAGIDWAYAPMVDVSRDARWGRIVEGYGEDALLNGIFGAAMVKGYQGEELDDKSRVIACMKHYVGGGAAEGGREYQYAELSERTLRDLYLPPFKAGIDAGALTVMSAFNNISGVPAVANSKLLNEVLRNEWNFAGTVISDWDAVQHLILHGIAKDSLQAGVLALKGGTDIEMKGTCFEFMEQALNNNPELEKYINQAVKRVLYLKFKKGLFDQPYAKSKELNEQEIKNNRKFAREFAAKTMVLLKNENNILPITNSQKLNIAVVGKFANEKELMGWWKSVAQTENVVSAFEGLTKNTPHNFTTQVKSNTDIIIYCMGEAFNEMGENNSKYYINLEKEQQDYLKHLKNKNKPIIGVVFNGRPMDLNLEAKLCDALLLAWHPGSEAGNALADIVYGKEVPAGKLTASFPANVGQTPIYYNYRQSGRPEFNDYKREMGKPLFLFGYGLSYTSFKYSDFNISKSDFTITDTLILTVTVTNTGNYDADEIVQFYYRDLVGSVSRPIKELLGFKKVFIKKGESKTISLKFTSEDLKFWDINMQYSVEPGEFKFMVGPNSQDLISLEAELF